MTEGLWKRGGIEEVERRETRWKGGNVWALGFVRISARDYIRTYGYWVWCGCLQVWMLGFVHISTRVVLGFVWIFARVNIGLCVG